MLFFLLTDPARFWTFPVGRRLCCELHVRKSSSSGIVRPTRRQELKSSAEIRFFFLRRKQLLQNGSFLTHLTRSFPHFAAASSLIGLPHLFAVFVLLFIFAADPAPIDWLHSVAARRGRAGGCAWAFYDPSSSSFHPVKCLTTINLNSPPWEIASTMRWVLICGGASGWSSVMPRSSPTRRQREILI